MKRAEIVKKLIDETGLSIKAFSEKADIPYTTLRSMLQRGIGNSSVGNAIKICKELGITVEQLEDMANGKYEDAYNLTYNEYEHIKSYRKISDIGQAYIDNMTNNLISYEKSLKNEIQASDEVTATKEIKETIKVYWAKAAAGIPLPVVTEQYDLVSKDKTVPQDADFGVVLQGDSMEPDYPDGCTVWVKSQPTLKHGDIGVFIIDGETTCKIFYNKDNKSSVYYNKL